MVKKIDLLIPAMRFILIGIVAISTITQSCGQEIKVMGHVFYGGASFIYNEDDYLHQKIKTSSIPAYGIQTSVQIVLSKGFRIGSGLNYIAMKGKTDPVFVDKDLLNTNTTGDFTLDVNSTYLQVPFEFIVTLTQKWKIKPFLVGGLNFYIPLKESYFVKIDPVVSTPYYGTVETEITEGTEYRGFLIGTGVILPLNEKREMEIRLSYQPSSFFYPAEVPGTAGVMEKRNLKFNIIALSIGVAIF